MELLVCIKQVPDDSVSVGLNADGTPKLDEITPVVNAFDTYALEMAARFKEAHGGSVTVLTVGGEGAVPALRSCLAVGADRACRLADESACDTQGIAYLLAQASKKAGEQPFDVIFCGSESTDASSAQVGAQVAELLGLPVITNVLALEPKDGGISAKQETEDGYRVVEAPCPCVVTIVSRITSPVIPPSRARWLHGRCPLRICPWRMWKPMPASLALRPPRFGVLRSARLPSGRAA
ncbi:MAG: electron transfer flavoprotein subunit beta/FixA family protein [Dysosmobacter sp.]